MTADQLAALFSFGFPLFFGIALLSKPGAFTKKDLSDPENEEVKKRLSLVGKLLLVAALLLGIANLGKLNAKNNLTTEEFLEQIVLNVNTKLPQAVDADTTLDRVSSEGSVIVYHYTIRDLDTANFTAEEFAAAVKPELVAMMKKEPKAALFRDRRVHVKHIYRVKDSAFVASVIIQPGEY